MTALGRPTYQHLQYSDQGPQPAASQPDRTHPPLAVLDHSDTQGMAGYRRGQLNESRETPSYTDSPAEYRTGFRAESAGPASSLRGRGAAASVALVQGFTYLLHVPWGPAGYSGRDGAAPGQRFRREEWRPTSHFSSCLRTRKGRRSGVPANLTGTRYAWRRGPACRPLRRQSFIPCPPEVTRPAEVRAACAPPSPGLTPSMPGVVGRGRAVIYVETNALMGYLHPRAEHLRRALKARGFRIERSDNREQVAG